MSAQSFYLPQLNVDVTSAAALLSGVNTDVLTADATADVNVPLSTFRELFQFQSDSIDIDNLDATDVKFRCVYTPASPIAPLGLDIDTSAVVSVSPIDNAGNKNITYDYTRHLAVELFNTHLGVDLFDNEEELRSSLNSSFKTALNDTLVGLTGSVNIKGTDTPSEAIFSQLINNTPSRFSQLDTYALPATEDGVQWYYMPGMVEDIFYFVLKVVAAAGQKDLTGVAEVADRTYLIRATIV